MKTPEKLGHSWSHTEWVAPENRAFADYRDQVNNSRWHAAAPSRVWLFMQTEDN